MQQSAWSGEVRGTGEWLKLGLAGFAERISVSLSASVRPTTTTSNCNRKLWHILGGCTVLACRCSTIDLHPVGVARERHHDTVHNQDLRQSVLRGHSISSLCLKASVYSSECITFPFFCPHRLVIGARVLCRSGVRRPHSSYKAVIVDTLARIRVISNSPQFNISSDTGLSVHFTSALNLATLKYDLRRQEWSPKLGASHAI